MPTLSLPDNQNQGLDTYSKILGIQKQQSEVKTAQALAAQTQADASLAQRKNAELSSLGTFFSRAPDMPEFKNADGSPNVDKLTTEANKIGPTFGQEVIGHYISNIKETANAHSALQTLGSGRAAQIGQGAAALASNPSLTKSDILDYFGKLRETNPDPAFGRALDSTLSGLKEGDSDSLRQQMANVASTFSGFAQSKPSTVETPVGIQPGVTGFKGDFIPSGASIPKESVITLPNQQIAKYNPKTNRYEFVGAGQGVSGKTPQVGGALYTSDNDPQRPGANSSNQKLAQWNEALAATSTHVRATQASDDAQGGVGTAMNRANVIDKLLKDTRTGPGTSFWQTGLAGAGAVVNGHPAQNYQELGMFLDAQAIALQSSMGMPNTNAAMEKSEHIIGSTANDSNAIRLKNDLVTGMRLGAHAYRNGLDTVANNGVNASPSAVGDVKKQWANNFDPNVYTYKWKQGQDRADFVKSLPPAEAATLAKKAKNLDKLERGELLK